MQPYFLFSAEMDAGRLHSNVPSADGRDSSIIANRTLTCLTHLLFYNQ